MEVIGAVLAGLVLLIFHLLTLFVMVGDIKRMILCTEITDAKVTTVTKDVQKHKDSKTGKVKYEYSYRVTFKYEHDGQTYESFHIYSKHCRYSENQITEIKINPHKPTESWTKGEFKNLLTISLIIPVYVFFDYLYVMIVFL